jgi:hypothetical protein
MQGANIFIWKRKKTVYLTTNNGHITPMKTKLKVRGKVLTQPKYRHSCI